MTNTITEETRDRIRAALLDETIRLGVGVGTEEAERCTIAEINLILTGTLDDGPHPCVSEVVRRWVVTVQDAIPDEIRNGMAWRTAAVGIAGSASTPEVEQRRTDMLLAWMWDRLADPAVIKAVSADALPVWRAMLTERTATAARIAARDSVAGGNAAAAAAYAAGFTSPFHAAATAASAASAAADVAVWTATATAANANANAAASTAEAAEAGAATNAAAAYWQRADAPGMLARLVTLEES